MVSRCLGLVAMAVCARVAAMVIDPVDPAFGVALAEFPVAATGALAELRGIAVTPSGGVAVLTLHDELRADLSACRVATIVMFRADGTLDPSFGAGGRASPAMLGLPDCVARRSLGFTVARDGALYLAGSPDGYPATEFAPPRVWKAMGDGRADAGFGNAGSAPLPGVQSMLRPTLTVRDDGSVAIGGTGVYVDSLGQRVPALTIVRLLASGVPDGDYGNAGVASAVPDRPIHEAEGGGVAWNADGSALVAGTIFEDDAGAKLYLDATVARFDARGRLDRTYGEAGFAIPLRDASTYAQSLAAIDGEAYLAGIQSRDVPYAFVAKLRTTGQVDLAFAAAGIAGSDRFRVTEGEPRVAVDASHRVYLALTDLHGHVAIMRLRADGQRDATFGLEGIAYVAATGFELANRAALAIASDVPYVGAGAFVARDDPARTAVGVTRLTPSGGHRDDIAGGSAVVYHHPALDHYFLTANPAEQFLLDNGITVGWSRTGDEFRVVTAGADADLSPVCRYYGRPEAQLDSHFFSAAPDECAAVAHKFSASWRLETDAAFAVHLPDRLTGACPRGSERVVRAFNNRADANHYYGLSASAPAGWTYEGYGPAPIPAAFCAPLL